MDDNKVKYFEQIKYNRTYLLFDKFFNELRFKKFEGHNIEEYYYDENHNMILNISHTDKDIMFRLRFLPEEIRNSELLYDYLKEFTTFKDYTVSEW